MGSLGETPKKTIRLENAYSTHVRRHALRSPSIEYHEKTSLTHILQTAY